MLLSLSELFVPGTCPITSLSEWDGNRAEIGDGVWMGALSSAHVPRREENELLLTGNGFSGAAGCWG